MVKSYSDFSGDSGYVTPECCEIHMTVEGMILTASGVLQDMSDNNIYREDF